MNFNEINTDLKIINKKEEEIKEEIKEVEKQEPDKDVMNFSNDEKP